MKILFLVLMVVFSTLGCVAYAEPPTYYVPGGVVYWDTHFKGPWHHSHHPYYHHYTNQHHTHRR